MDQPVKPSPDRPLREDPEHPAPAAVSGKSDDLPGPMDLPQAEVVVYDGRCRFCRRQVARLRRWCGDRVAFLSLHDPEARRRYPDLSHEMLMEQMYLIDRWGRRHAGADVLRRLSAITPALWPLYLPLRVPGVMLIARWIYRRIARARYKLGGQDCDDGACSIHWDS